MTLIDELLREFPDLEPQKDTIVRILDAMKNDASPPVLDDAFVQKLRATLINTDVQRDAIVRAGLKPAPANTIKSFFLFMQQKTFALAGAAIAILVMLPAGYALWKINNDNGGFSNTTHSMITMLDAGAFGDLTQGSYSGTPDGKGGGLQGDESALVSDVTSNNKLVTSETSIAVGEPYPYEPTVYIYTFDGDLAPYLTDTSATVYERQAFSAFAGSALNELTSAFSSLSISPFLAGNLVSFTLNKNGYTLSVDTLVNMWTINKDWSPSNDTIEWRPLEASDIPSDEAIIATAKSFANTWGIALENYGAPVIAESEIALARAGTKDMFIPESATVVFPTRINDQTIHSPWTSTPNGLFMSVDFRTMTVTYTTGGSLNQAFNASSYELTQDTELVQRLIAGGGSAPVTYDGIAMNEVVVPVKNPERILMEYGLYENGTTRTLFIPALRFSLEDASQLPWTGGAITVPLVKEIAKTQDHINDDVVVQDGMTTPMIK